ncbi:hypothetical protein HGM15179_015750, partial [Zosterops borbonicus]
IIHRLATSCFLVTIAITIKLGLVPFHLKFPEVLQGSSLSTTIAIRPAHTLPTSFLYSLGTTPHNQGFKNIGSNKLTSVIYKELRTPTTIVRNS